MTQQCSRISYGRWNLLVLVGLGCLTGLGLVGDAAAADGPAEPTSMSVATFTADITPPVGHPLCAGWYGPAKGITDRLSAVGLVLTGPEKPIVLCALDWAELSNRDHLRWRQALAAAGGTEPDRVAVHCIHAHDAPWPDRDAQDLLDKAGYPNLMMTPWCEKAREAVTEALRKGLAETRQPCTHVAVGQARVKQIASTRRIMGDNGRVKAVRLTVTRNPAIRAEPEGLIDPFLKTISFWNKDHKLAVVHYYAVHNTSYDRDGRVTPDFFGLARNRRSAADGNVPHLIFNGCAGNITAGKYNDGNPQNRAIFTDQLLAAMVASEKDTRRAALTRWAWRVEPVVLPPRQGLSEAQLEERMRAPTANTYQRTWAALLLTYIRRQDLPIPITALHLGSDVSILHLPGEAFIEYQLDAQSLRANAFVAVASYGDLGTGYIPLERSFREGGYEPTDSFVSGKAEAILREAIRKVLLPPPL